MRITWQDLTSFSPVTRLLPRRSLVSPWELDHCSKGKDIKLPSRWNRVWPALPSLQPSIQPCPPGCLVTYLLVCLLSVYLVSCLLVDLNSEFIIYRYCDGLHWTCRFTLTFKPWMILDVCGWCPDFSNYNMPRSPTPILFLNSQALLQNPKPTILSQPRLPTDHTTYNLKDSEKQHFKNIFYL